MSPYTTLHYTTLHTTLHTYILQYTLHYTTLHQPTQHTTLHYSTHYPTLHYTTLPYTTLPYTTLRYTTLHYPTLPYTTLSVNRALIFLCEPRFSDPGYMSSPAVSRIEFIRLNFRIFLLMYPGSVKNRSEKEANNLSAKHVQCHRQWPEPNRPQRCTSHGRPNVARALNFNTTNGCTGLTSCGNFATVTLTVPEQQAAKGNTRVTYIHTYIHTYIVLVLITRLEDRFSRNGQTLKNRFA